MWKVLNKNRTALASAHQACNHKQNNTDKKSADKTVSTANNTYGDNDDDSLLKMTGGIMIGSPDSEVIQGTMKSVKEHNLLHEVLDAQEIRKRYPLFNVSSTDIGSQIRLFLFLFFLFFLITYSYAIADCRIFFDKIITKVMSVNHVKICWIFIFYSGIYETDAGYLVPESCVDSHLNEATSSGAELHFNETVLSWSLYTSTTLNISMSSNEKYSSMKDPEKKNNDEDETFLTDEEVNQKTKTEKNENIFQVFTQDANGISRTYLTKKIVIAAGPWAPELYGDEISTPLHAVRRIQLWFEPKNNKDLFKVGSPSSVLIFVLLSDLAEKQSDMM